ncbi:hypothetical protein UT300018_27690 [Clostridium faecium]|uniref:CopG family transcriptional regulator n=1 Tax=Clostridium faecium TaxID=2762223 RepID=A0ABR8YUN1_9CLOT|nr:hypothetical protein [Clostridium faecium]MBD8047972.1 hypothetical protein [Clostridium faecium]
MNTKRVNLCFNLENERARKAFEIIQQQGAKTAFIIDAVLAYIDRDNELYKEIVKEGVKEAIEELGLEMAIKKAEGKKEDEALPDDIFQMLSGL